MIALRALSSIVGLQACGAVILFGVLLLLTAILGPENYGRYVWVVSMASVGALLVQMGLPTTILKRFSPLEMTSVDGSSPLANTLTVFVLITLVVISLALLAHAALPNYARSEVFWALPGAFAMACLLLSDSVLRAANRSVLSNVIQNIVRPGSLLLGTMALSAWGITAPQPYLALYTISALAAALFFVFPLMVKALRVSHAWSLMAPDGAHFQVSLSRTISSHLPIFITGFFVTPDILAYLAIAMRVTGPVRFGVNATRAYYGAKINKSIKQMKPIQAQKQYRNAQLFSVAMAIPGAIFLVTIGYYLAIMENGPFADFDDVGLLLQLLILVALSHLSVAMFGPVQLVAIMLHQEKFVRNLNLAFLLLFFVSLTFSAWIGDLRLSAISMLLYSIGVAGGIAWRVRDVFITTIEQD